MYKTEWINRDNNIVNLGLLIVSGSLNSYEHLSITDCSFTFDHAIKTQNTIESNLKTHIINSKDLYNLYFLLTENGLKNIKRYYSFIFKIVKTNHINTFELSINDFNFVNKIYSQ